MSSKRDVFWILDNYTTNNGMAQEVKDYINALSAENERLKKKPSPKLKGSN